MITHLLCKFDIFGCSLDQQWLAEYWQHCLFTVQTEWISHYQPKIWRKIQKNGGVWTSRLPFLESMRWASLTNIIFHWRVQCGVFIYVHMTCKEGWNESTDEIRLELNTWLEFWMLSPNVDQSYKTTTIQLSQYTPYWKIEQIWRMNGSFPSFFPSSEWIWST